MADKELIREVIKEWENSKGITVLEDNINAMNKLLKGNGNIGLCETVRKLDTKIDGVRASMKPLWVLVSIIGTALLTGIIKMFWG